MQNNAGEKKEKTGRGNEKKEEIKGEQYLFTVLLK